MSREKENIVKQEKTKDAPRKKLKKSLRKNSEESPETGPETSPQTGSATSPETGPGKSSRKNPRQQWQDLGPQRRGGAKVLALIQITLAVAAWADLARRPADRVNGRKGMWAGIIAVNYIGPAAYFLKGRRTEG